MEAKKIYYNENVFRSKLEAMWAVFFDEIGVAYQYEPERFKIKGQRKKYLPDFYLPNVYLRNEHNKGVYIEIKNRHYCSPRFDKIGGNFEGNIVLFCGSPGFHFFFTPKCQTPNSDSGFQYCSRFYVKEGEYISEFSDHCMKIFKCESCGVVKIEFEESSYDFCPVCESQNDTKFLENAAEKAWITFYSNKQNTNHFKPKL